MELTEPFDQLLDDRNLNYYTMAGQIAAKVLDVLVNMAKPSVKIVDLCTKGDEMIIDETNKVCKNVTIKGIAFPTCVSINEMVGFNSPLFDDKTIIKDGDLVKIELGVHINGFPAIVCFTVLVNDSAQKISDRRADVMKAAIEASRNIINIMKPGNTNEDVAKAMSDAAKKYNCSLPTIHESMHAPGVPSYQISQFVIDGYNNDDAEFVHRFILSRPWEDGTGMRKLELEMDEVYAIDVVMSTGSGKLSKANNATIYKRNLEKWESLKLKTSRDTLTSIGKTRFPIHIRTKDNMFKFGLKECISKGLIEEYPACKEKNGEYVARIKFTVIVRDKPILVVGRSANKELDKLT
jgi:curved DNA binding protein